jgi:hypothetical protein
MTHHEQKVAGSTVSLTTPDTSACSSLPRISSAERKKIALSMIAC